MSTTTSHHQLEAPRSLKTSSSLPPSSSSSCATSTTATTTDNDNDNDMMRARAMDPASDFDMRVQETHSNDPFFHRHVPTERSTRVMSDHDLSDHHPHHDKSGPDNESHHTVKLIPQNKANTRRLSDSNPGNPISGSASPSASLAVSSSLMNHAEPLNRKRKHKDDGTVPSRAVGDFNHLRRLASPMIASRAAKEKDHLKRKQAEPGDDVVMGLSVSMRNGNYDGDDDDDHHHQHDHSSLQEQERIVQHDEHDDQDHQYDEHTCAPNETDARSHGNLTSFVQGNANHIHGTSEQSHTEDAASTSSAGTDLDEQLARHSEALAQADMNLRQFEDETFHILHRIKRFRRGSGMLVYTNMPPIDSSATATVPPLATETSLCPQSRLHNDDNYDAQHTGMRTQAYRYPGRVHHVAPIGGQIPDCSLDPSEDTRFTPLNQPKKHVVTFTPVQDPFLDSHSKWKNTTATVESGHTTPSPTSVLLHHGPDTPGISKNSKDVNNNSKTVHYYNKSFVHPNDFLCGSQVSCEAHPGNAKLQSMVSELQFNFNFKATAVDEFTQQQQRVVAIATFCIAKLKELRPPGRILERCRSKRGSNSRLAHSGETIITLQTDGSLWRELSGSQFLLRIRHELERKAKSAAATPTRSGRSNNHSAKLLLHGQSTARRQLTPLAPMPRYLYQQQRQARLYDGKEKVDDKHSNPKTLIGPMDILLSANGLFLAHEKNHIFRDLVRKLQMKYRSLASPLEQVQEVRNLLSRIERQCPQCRFLQGDPNGHIQYAYTMSSSSSSSSATITGVTSWTIMSRDLVLAKMQIALERTTQPVVQPPVTMMMQHDRLQGQGRLLVDPRQNDASHRQGFDSKPIPIQPSPSQSTKPPSHRSPDANKVVTVVVSNKNSDQKA